MKTYQIILSKKGKEIFKGGNIEPMSIPLMKFEAENKREAEAIFNKIIMESVGSGSFPSYEFIEVKR